jgi:hypothetical protein
MMDCTHYRRSMLAAPRDADPELRAHRDGCPECALFTANLLRFEQRLEQALLISMTTRPAARRRWLAMAASLVLAMLVGGTLWLSIPGRSLAADVVTHMQGEPDAWRRTAVAVPEPALAQVLAGSHLRLAGPPGIVSYASSCSFRGHHVPHLVMQTAAGPVTVMVLEHDRVMKTTRFDEEGYRGIIVPVAGHGSLAVLTRGHDTDISSIESLAARVAGSIVWSATP